MSEHKTTECCFCEAKYTKQGADRAECTEATECDYATVPVALAEDVATSNPEPSIRVSHNFVCVSLRLILLALGGPRFTHIPTKRSIIFDAPFSLTKGFKTAVLNPL